MKDPRTARLAGVVIEYSTRLKKGESATVAGSPAAAPLLLAIYEKALAAGAFMYIRCALPEAQEIFYRTASDELLDFLPKIDLLESENVVSSISVVSPTNTRPLASVPPEKIARVRMARQKIKEARRNHRWNVVTWPTEALAQDASMSLSEYEDFVFTACFCDREDPVAAWSAFREELRGRAAKIDRPSEVVVKGEGTDLVLKIGNRKTCVSCGEVNMPDGEIYMGPVEDGVDGTIRFAIPAVIEGTAVEDVRFRFKKGRVIEATASRGQALLDKMLSVDEGARQVGELGIGCNFGIYRPTLNLLFDEKIGGTIHLGMGQAYAETEGKNHSAIHLDFVCDLLKGGEVTVDGKLLLRDGKFYM